MGFCSFSSEKVLSECTSVSNIFINEYLPYANDTCVKVYLYGLYVCGHSDCFDNKLASFSKVLNISEEDIESCFRQWEELGLVKILNLNPIEVKYLKVDHNRADNKKLKAGKYSDFCASVQEIITGRMVSTNEYYEYMTFLDYSNMEPSALLMIIKYCVTLKGEDIGYSYILTIAKAWAYKKILTTEQTEIKIAALENENDKLYQILKIFGIARKPYFEDNEMYTTFTEEYGFDFSVIFAVAKGIKNKSKVGLNLLKTKLDKYYSLGLFTINEITDYETQKQAAFTTAKEVVKNLGLYYENLEPVVENYVYNWIKLGYDNETLVTLANYCFKSNIKSLESMNDKLQKLYKLGLVSINSLQGYISDLQSTDGTIKKLLDNLGIDRKVNSFDRDCYRTWSFNWGFSDELVEYAASQSVSKNAPMQYLNKLLSIYHEKKITNVEQAKTQNITFTSDNAISKQTSINTTSYNKEQLSALFDNLNDIKI